MDNSSSKSSPMETIGESEFPSDSLYFQLESFQFFIRENQQFTMVLFTNVYLTVTIMGIGY